MKQLQSSVLPVELWNRILHTYIWEENETELQSSVLHVDLWNRMLHMYIWEENETELQGSGLPVDLWNRILHTYVWEENETELQCSVLPVELWDKILHKYKIANGIREIGRTFVVGRDSTYCQNVRDKGIRYNIVNNLITWHLPIVKLQSKCICPLSPNLSGTLSRPHTFLIQF